MNNNKNRNIFSFSASFTLSLFLLLATTANSQLPIAKGQQPTANSQQPIADSIQLPWQSKNIEVTASIDTGTIVIGDQRELHIKATNRHSGQPMPTVVFPTMEMLTTGAIEALTSHNDTTKTKDGAIESIEQVVTITTFEAGHNAIGGIVVQTEEGGTAILLAPQDSLFINAVYEATADTTKCELGEDAPFQKESYTFWEIARWIILAIAVAALVLAIVLIIRSRKTHQPVPFLPKPKQIPADKKALNELEALRRKELWQKGRIKKYYTDMTDIVRRFLRNMYGISAAEMTSRQTLRAFHNISDWSEESETLLRQLLHQADMVKFAKSQPQSHEHDMAMQNAIDFIRKVAETHKINNPEEEKK